MNEYVVNQYVEMQYIVNGTTCKKIFRGDVEVCQIRYGVGSIRFVGIARDLSNNRAVSSFMATHCESITKYVE